MSYRDIQKANANTTAGSPNPDDSELSDVSQIKSLHQKYFRDRQPFDPRRYFRETSSQINYQDPYETLDAFEKMGYGQSRYDQNVDIFNFVGMNPSYIADQRGEAQPWWDQLKNGVLKGAITTGTTFVNVLSGLPLGAAEAAAMGDISRIWDNEITNLMTNIDDASEQLLPNYYTNEELDSPWYTNIFTANFLGDKLIKNFGFTFGAAAAGKIISKVPKLLPKVTTKIATAAGKAERDVAAIGRVTNSFSTSFLSAVGEGSIEALHATKEWSSERTNAIQEDYQAELENIDNYYINKANELKKSLANTEMLEPALMSLQEEYQKAIQDLELDKENKMAQVASQRAQLGNVVLGFNLPILTLGNLLTLGKVYAKGYTAEMSSIPSHVKMHPEALAHAGETVEQTRRKLTLRGFKDVTKKVKQQVYTDNFTVGKNIAKTMGSAAWEGTEEMLQAWAANTSKMYNTDYYNISVDPEYTEKTASMWKSLGDAFAETFGNIDNWEEFAIGMLSGGISNMVLGQTAEMKRERKAVNKLTQQLNEAVNTFNNRAMIMGINRHQYYEDAKTDAAIAGNEKKFKDADFNQLASDVVMFASVGKLDELKAIIDYNLENLSDEELDKIAEDLSQKDEHGEHNHFVKLDTAGKRQYLKDQQEKYHKIIDDYSNEYNEITAIAGNRFGQEQLSELVFERLRAKNAGKRIEELNKEIIEALNNITVDFSDLASESKESVDAISAVLAAKQARLQVLNERLAQQQAKMSKTKKLKRSGLERAIEKTKAQIDKLQMPVSDMESQLDIIKEYFSFVPDAVKTYNDLFKFFKDNFDKFAQVTADSLFVTKNFTEEGVTDVREKMYLMEALTSNFLEAYKDQLPNDISQSSQQVFKKIHDMIELTADARYYNEKVEEFIQNPQKLEEKNEGIRERAIKKINQKKANKVLPELRNTSSYVKFANTVMRLSPDVRDIVLDTLKKENNLLANEYEKKNRLLQVASDYIQHADEIDLTKGQALNLLAKGINELPLKEVTNTDNPIYSEENNEELFATVEGVESNYPQAIKLLSEALTKAQDELNNATTSSTNSNSITQDTEEIPDASEEDTSTEDDFDATVAQTDQILEDEESFENLEGSNPDTDNEVDEDFDKYAGAEPDEEQSDDFDFQAGASVESDEGYFENSAEDTENTKDPDLHPSTEDLNRENELDKVSSKEGIEKDVAKAEEFQEQQQQKKDKRPTPSLREYDYEGAKERVIDKKDENGQPTLIAQRYAVLYDYLSNPNKLNAFANIDNGLVKKGDKVFFGVYPKMDREISTDDYTAFTILMFAEDEHGEKHCVGHLVTSNGNHQDLLNKLKEEFKGKLNTDEILYSQYYSIVDELWAGFVRYDENSWRPATQEDFKAIRERMQRDGQNLDDVTPFITIATGSPVNQFIQGAGATIKIYTGTNQSVSSIYNDRFYSGTAVIMVPTGAYDRNADVDNQPEKAYIPMGINRTKAAKLGQDTKTYQEIDAAIRALFAPNLTRGQLKNRIGRIKELLVLTYMRGNDIQEVHFDAATHKHDEEGHSIPDEFVEMSETNSYWAKNNMTIDDAQVLVLMIRNGENKKFVPLHTGNVKSSQPLSKEEIDKNVEEIRNYLFNDLSAFVNIQRSKLTNPDYINQLINDGLIQINTKPDSGLRSVSNSFALNPQIKSIADTDTTVQEKSNTAVQEETQVQQEETTKPAQPTTTSLRRRVGAFKPDEGPKARSVQLAVDSYERADIEKEVDRVMKMLPQLSREEVFQIVSDLITINEEGEKAFGLFHKNRIILSNLAEVGTTYHEAFHLVMNSLLTDAEQNALFAEYKAIAPKASLYQLEEMMAEDFREYCLMKEAPLSQKIHNWFKRLYNLIFGYTKNTPVFDSVAKKIWRGKYADRQLKDASQLSDTKYRLISGISYQSNGPVIHAEGNHFWIGDLSVDRFQRYVDAQINNISYSNRGQRASEMNNRWGVTIDKWGSIGVNIKGKKVGTRYVVTSVDVTNNTVQYYNQKWQQYLEQQRTQNPNDPFGIEKKCYV